MKLFRLTKRFISWLGIGFILSLVMACSSEVDSRKLVITGSSTLAPLLAEIAQRFELQHPDVRVNVQSGGSSRGISDVRKDISHIGMVSRSPNHSETDLHWHALARDGVSIIVHKDNPATELSQSQIVDIYTGRARDWGQVNGHNQAVTVINKAEGRSTLEVFLQHFGLSNSQIKADVVIGDNQQGIKTVSANIGAIGYVSIGAAAYEAQHGTPIKLLRTSGADATVENVRNGSFPIARTLHLITRNEPSGLAREFLQFAMSELVYDLIEGQYFVPFAK